MDRLIGRYEAVRTIYEVINSGIIEEGLEEKLTDIASCIEAEDEGLHMWGSTMKDHVEINTMRRDDLWDIKIPGEDETYRERATRIRRYHTYTPSIFELKEGCNTEDPEPEDEAYDPMIEEGTVIEDGEEGE